MRGVEGLGARIRAERERREWSLAELARLCGVSKSTIGRYELGQGCPTVQDADRILRALGTSIVIGGQSGTGGQDGTRAEM